MKKKYRAFTIYEMVAVIAILGILIAISVPNIIRMNRKALLDKFTNQTASMIREIYTKIDDEMSYDTYFLEIDNYFPTIDNNNIIVRSIKKDGLNLIVLRENKTNLISLKLENGFMSFADGTRVFLTFDKDGNIVIRQNSIALPPIGPYQNALIEIGVKNSSIPSKKIKIDSDMISGSVVIE